MAQGPDRTAGVLMAHTMTIVAGVPTFTCTEPFSNDDDYDNRSQSRSSTTGY